jgi:hypothetical protein
LFPLGDFQMSSHRQMTMPFQLKIKHIWAHGFLIGLILGGLGFLAYYFVVTIPSPPEINPSRPFAEAQPKQILPSDLKATSLAPSNSVASLETELSQVFDGIKETNQKKDLDQLLSFYSPNYPQLSKKAQSIKRSWKFFDYQDMAFKVQEIKLLTENTVSAWVTWDVVAKNLETHKVKNISKTYQVTFVKESGQWHILGLKNAPR